MSRNAVIHLLRTSYFIRFPLITLVLLAGFGPFARHFEPELLLGLLDLDSSFGGLWLVTMTAFLCAAAAISGINVTLRYGVTRFGLPRSPDNSKALVFALGVVSATVLVGYAFAVTQIFWITGIAAVILGAGVALGLVVGTRLLQLLLSDKSTQPKPIDNVLPQLPDAISAPAFDRPAPGPVRVAQTRIAKVITWFYPILLPAGEGYFVHRALPVLTLRSGHMFALMLSVATALLYVGIGWAKRRSIDSEDVYTPSLMYVLIALTLACWVFSALAFFLDRYRIPVLLTLSC